MTNTNKLQVVLPSLLTDIEESLIQKGTPKPHVDRFLNCLKANIEGGKLNRDLSHALLHRPLIDIEFEHLSILGWLTELFQAVYLMWDDIMDGSETRRGKPCWHRQQTVG
ncbi:hypothetical protein N7530_008834 [Penicillium desertorum]|uniref:Uncharacterized protein n=1 Tax=Penicillium desertorum TaxID=1303715 RepID=A0A9W9WPU3_9EURO|nr:hypothetical protein N7530_008834 [Penicillium desertorum]